MLPLGAPQACLKVIMIIVQMITYPTDADWLLVRNAALETQRKQSTKTPDFELRQKYLMAEHSPIRELWYRFRIIDIPSWNSVHLVRHHEGILHFVSSQRNDIQKLYDRRKAPQDAPVNHRISVNAQALINISKARTCLCASAETRNLWLKVIETIGEVSPEIYPFLVPPCIYRNGICPEVFKPCGYNHTPSFAQRCADYYDMFAKYS